MVIVLLGKSGAAKLLEGPAIVTGHFDSVFCGGRPLDFFLPLAFCLQSFSSISSAMVSSYFLWVANSVWHILCRSSKCFLSVIWRILSGILFARLGGCLIVLVCCQTIPHLRFASFIARAAFYLHLLFFYFVTSFQYILPAPVTIISKDPSKPS